MKKPLLNRSDNFWYFISRNIFDKLAKTITAHGIRLVSLKDFDNRFAIFVDCKGRAYLKIIFEKDVMSYYRRSDYYD